MNEYIRKLYQQLTGHTVNEALLAFQQLVIKDGRTGDLYFETYGVPNTIELFNAPYERFVCYELLMQMLKNEDATKFSSIHKGTPYYFLAWAAFEIRNFSKAVFYMDLALGEDIRKSTTPGKSQADATREALNNPGGNLWKFVPEGPAARVIQQLKQLITKELQNYKNRTSEEIKLDEFVDKFVIENIVQDVKNRSLISSFYSYMTEADDLYQTLKIRSQNLSSIEPLLNSLFKGGLIFESLQKVVADQKTWTISTGRGSGRRPSTLEGFSRCNDFLTLFGLVSGDFVTSAPDLQTTLSNANDDSLKTSFSTTAQLRNTAGHDLRRDDIFQNPDDYARLINKQLNAIFFVIKRAFV